MLNKKYIPSVKPWKRSSISQKPNILSRSEYSLWVYSEKCDPKNCPKIKYLNGIRLIYRHIRCYFMSILEAKEAGEVESLNDLSRVKIYYKEQCIFNKIDISYEEIELFILLKTVKSIKLQRHMQNYSYSYQPLALISTPSFSHADIQHPQTHQASLVQETAFIPYSAVKHSTSETTTCDPVSHDTGVRRKTHSPQRLTHIAAQRPSSTITSIQQKRKGKSTTPQRVLPQHNILCSEYKPQVTHSVMQTSNSSEPLDLSIHSRRRHSSDSSSRGVITHGSRYRTAPYTVPTRTHTITSTTTSNMASSQIQTNTIAPTSVTQRRTVFSYAPRHPPPSSSHK